MLQRCSCGGTTRDCSSGSEPHVPPVIVVLVGRSGQSHVSHQLGSVASVQFSADADAVLTRASAGQIHAIVAELHDAAGRPITPFVVSLTARAPAVPLVIYDRADRDRMETLRTMLAPGIGVEFVVRPFEPLAPVMHRALGARLPPTVAPVLLHHVVSRAPPSLRVFLSLAALKAPTRRGVRHLALWSGMSPRTVERRLSRAGWATAQVILQSFRALDVIWLMAEYHWSARRVKEVRGFAHASVITRLTQRYGGGVTPATLRESGGFTAALDAVVRAVTAPPETR
jgi:hypothetical protein